MTRKPFLIKLARVKASQQADPAPSSPQESDDSSYTETSSSSDDGHSSEEDDWDIGFFEEAQQGETDTNGADALEYGGDDDNEEEGENEIEETGGPAAEGGVVFSPGTVEIWRLDNERRTVEMKRVSGVNKGNKAKDVTFSDVEEKGDEGDGEVQPEIEEDGDAEPEDEEEDKEEEDKNGEPELSDKHEKKGKISPNQQKQRLVANKAINAPTATRKGDRKGKGTERYSPTSGVGSKPPVQAAEESTQVPKTAARGTKGAKSQGRSFPNLRGKEPVNPLAGTTWEAEAKKEAKKKGDDAKAPIVVDSNDESEHDDGEGARPVATSAPINERQLAERVDAMLTNTIEWMHAGAVMVEQLEETQATIVRVLKRAATSGGNRARKKGKC
ncbi:hypothetical protein BU23DRAFT_318059 [Bimuria novae-zelandiae CBS 107.79]|uniref:Uncharacterized protein n=1 Tax=Bimuria novae-zelandiae CBS 107.79 TaxID=1447943 RepID=A0A6A5VHG6_9PLEO|nr:hypothetical protein BU23DRAFT_318059 [Bimuria novae-zelandiae CBS 107.79]